jgi:hypothetical protein
MIAAGIDVRVRGVDREIGAVHPIAEHFKIHGHAAAVARHIPPVEIRPRRLELAAVRRKGVHVVTFLAKS